MTTRTGRVVSVWGRYVKVIIPAVPMPLGYIDDFSEYNCLIETQWIDSSSNWEFLCGELVYVTFSDASLDQPQTVVPIESKMVD